MYLKKILKRGNISVKPININLFFLRTIRSGVAVVAGAISDPLAHGLAWMAWPLPAYTNRLVEALAGIPGGVIVLGEMNIDSVILLYAAALGLPAAVLRRGVWSAYTRVTIGYVNNHIKIDAKNTAKPI